MYALCNFKGFTKDSSMPQAGEEGCMVQAVTQEGQCIPFRISKIRPLLAFILWNVSSKTSRIFCFTSLSLLHPTENPWEARRENLRKVGLFLWWDKQSVVSCRVEIGRWSPGNWECCRETWGGQWRGGGVCVGVYTFQPNLLWCVGYLATESIVFIRFPGVWGPKRY